MKNSLVIIMSFLLLSLVTGLTIGSASAASTYDKFSASTDGKTLSHCPTVFQCGVL